jgi:two-component system sensor histidine kinase AtoS
MVRVRRENRALREQAAQLRARADVPEKYLKHISRESYSRGRSSQMESLKAFHKAITNIREPEELCGALLEAIADCFSVGTAALVLEDKDRNTLSVSAQRGLEDAFLRQIRLRPGEGIYMWLGRNAEILLVEQTEAGENLRQAEAIRKEAALLRAKVCVPLTAHGALMGYLTLGGKITGAQFTEAELMSLYAMAADAAAAIVNARSYGEARSRKASLENILQAVRCGIVATDAEGVVIAINGAAAEMVGISLEEASGKHAQKLGSALADVVLRTLKEKKEYRGKITAPVTKRPLEVSAGILKNERGDAVGALMVLTDETLLPKQVAEVHEELFRRLSDRISHYVGNKLVPIYGFMQKKRDDSNLVDEISRSVDKPARELENLIKRLEDLSRPLHLSLAEHDMELFLKDLVSRKSQTTSERGIDIRFSCDLRDKRASFDTDRLRRAIECVVENSIESFSGAEAKSAKTIEIRTRDYQGQNGRELIEFLIVDNGKGIDPDDLEHVFEPFYTNKEALAVGMGLGLPLAKKIITAHGGSIEIESKKGEGTTVRITFPRRGPGA